MGDMADMALEQVETMESLRLEYRTGNMDAEEAYDLGFIDELGYEETAYSGARGVVYCRYCGGKLHWGHFPVGWRTVEIDGTIHKCPHFKRSSNER